jgi:hypothetical protein
MSVEIKYKEFFDTKHLGGNLKVNSIHGGFVWVTVQGKTKNSSISEN